MNRSSYSLLAPLIFLICLSSRAQQKRPATGKQPPWVTVNEYNYKDQTLDHEAEDGYFDVGYEQQVSLEQQSSFCRRAIKVLTEAGIENSSEISVSFDPSYEQLIFHTLRIVRGNTIINHLDLSKFKIIQQEKELGRHLYNGSLSSVIFLEDVRKGDIIEYSYTRKGFNPIFRNKYANVYDLNFGVPVGLLYYKLIVPKGRQVTVKNNNTVVNPVIRKSFDDTIYEWRLDHVNALHLQDAIPSWYDPYAAIMVSEYKSWKEVSDWAIDLFPVIENISAPLREKINEIRAQNSTAEQRIAASLRFVQDDIRYMGIEMGENSHRPEHPDKIFARRFGDCKDKAYLFCTLLHALGIEASPVLINTTYKKTITGWLPSAKAFDHVTARVHLNDKYYWFDPTISLQRGSLDILAYPDYQYGLVISPGTDSLIAINVKEPGMITIKEVFDILDMTGDARLTVVTHYTGSFADDIRGNFNNSSRYEMQKTFREFYASYYDQITADSLQYTDEERTGKFTTKEYYTINNLWKLKEGVKKVVFEPYVINGIIKKPKDLKRNMPFALTWPAKYKEEIEINLPENWSAEQSSNKINTTSFLMTDRFSFDGRKTVDLDYSYENLKDYVEASGMKEYMNGLDTKDKEFDYVLSYSPDNQPLSSLSDMDKKKNNTTNLIVGLLVLLVVVAFVWWTQRR